jgi:hypothetical protein
VVIMVATGYLSNLEAALDTGIQSPRRARLSGGQEGPVITDLQQGDALPHTAQHADDGCREHDGEVAEAAAFVMN